MRKLPITYYWRKLKLEVIFAYAFYVAYFRTLKNRHLALSYTSVLEAIADYRNRRRFLGRLEGVFIPNGRVFIKLTQFKDGPSTAFFKRLITATWLYEKMEVNVEHTAGKHIRAKSYFQSSVILKQYKKIDPKPCVVHLRLPIFYKPIAEHIVPPEFGYRVLSKLRISSEIKEQVDRYINPYADEDWIAVHYRGTDVRELEWRYMPLESYIFYLKKVLDDRHRIFACSDQAQFIDAMHAAFPGRVFATDVQRSYDEFPIHIGREGRHAKPHQKREALIDLLILARAELIYTTGSGFVDSVRWFNPHTKIISLDGRKRKGNYLAIPKKEMINHAVK